jgi:NTP pyrophosphatase (non-canonical NTP hydrolase)
MSRPIEDFIREMQEDSVRWFENGQDIVILTLGLVGESGEVADLLKKFMRGSMNQDDMIREMEVELIDVFHYWCLLIGTLGTDVDTVYQKKRSYNVARYEPKGVQEASE